MKSSIWIRMFCPGTEDQHIFAVPDEGHRICEDRACPCGPKIDIEHRLVIHRSDDGREYVEEAEAIIRES